MTTELKERDAVKRERRAFARGRCAALHEMDLGDARDAVCDRCFLRAKEVYPLAPLKQPRVLTTFPGNEQWKLFNGVYWWRYGKNQWQAAVAANPSITLTEQRVKVWADLLANPTEEVEDSE